MAVKRELKMKKNNMEFNVKDAKNINKLLLTSYKKIDNIINPEELNLLHNHIIDFIVSCEQMLQFSQTKLNKKEFTPNTKKIINGYVYRWTNNAQVVYERLSAVQDGQSMKTDSIRSFLFWFLKRREYQEVELNAKDIEYSEYKPSADSPNHFATQVRSYTDEDLPARVSY